MAGIGDKLRAERRRQGRTLADAAAETRVRESYLAAIEEEDFDVLGGDVYARGFIRLYGRYLSLDAEALVEAYRADFGPPPEVAPFPSNSYDDILPPERSTRLNVSPPILAAVGMVGLLVVLFVFFRSTSGPADEDALDPNAPGPSPAEVDVLPGEVPDSDPEAELANTPADPILDGAPDEATGEALLEVVIDVVVVGPVRLNVVRGQPPVSNALLEAGDFRQLTGDPGVIFELSDASAVEISINGQRLDPAAGPGQAVQVTCLIGSVGCDVVVL